MGTGRRYMCIWNRISNGAALPELSAAFACERCGCSDGAGATRTVVGWAGCAVSVSTEPPAPRKRVCVLHTPDTRARQCVRAVEAEGGVEAANWATCSSPIFGGARD